MKPPDRLKTFLMLAALLGNAGFALALEEEDLIGLWKDALCTPSGEPANLIFSQGDDYMAIRGETDTTNRPISESGKWKIAGDKLFLFATHRIEIAGGRVIRKAIKEKSDTLAITEFAYDRGFERYKIMVGGKTYWKYPLPDTSALREIMFQSARTNDVVGIERALLLGANPYSVRSPGWQIIHEACENNAIDVARFIIDKGFNPNALTGDNDNTCPLMLSVESENIYLTRLLIEKDVDVNTYCYVAGPCVTPLHRAITKNNLELVKMLIENGADLKLKAGGQYSCRQLAQDASDKRIFDYIEDAHGAMPCRIKVSGHDVLLLTDNKQKSKGTLAVSGEFPFGFDAIYEFSPDSTYVAFVEKTLQGYDIFVVSEKNE